MGRAAVVFQRPPVPRPSLRPTSSAWIGRVVLGGHRVCRLLRRGGSCEVYVAEAPGGNRAAIKVLRRDRLADPVARARLRREFLIGSLVRHPNVTTTRAYEQVGNEPLLGLDLLDGDDLHTVIRNAGRLTERQAARLMLDICDGLSSVHAAGFVHRDVKPENVLVTAERAVLIDLGIAKRFGAHRSSVIDLDELTAAGSLVGTPEYFSPEQGISSALSPLQDVYGCGLVLFEMVTGERAVQRMTPLEALAKHAHGPPLDPSRHVEVSEPFRAIVSRALEQDPPARFPSIEALRTALLVAFDDFLGEVSRRVPLPIDHRAAVSHPAPSPSPWLKEEPEGADDAITVPRRTDAVPPVRDDAENASASSGREWDDQTLVDWAPPWCADTAVMPLPDHVRRWLAVQASTPGPKSVSGSGSRHPPPDDGGPSVPESCTSSSPTANDAVTSHQMAHPQSPTETAQLPAATHTDQSYLPPWGRSGFDVSTASAVRQMRTRGVGPALLLCFATAALVFGLVLLFGMSLQH